MSLHPDWCDPGTCSIEPEYGHGATHYLHTLRLLCEEWPHSAPARQPVRVVVEVFRSDLRRDSDGVLVDVWGKPAELDPVKVYVAGLDQVDLDAEQARQVADALARASCVVAGSVHAA
jgi:hypothetical protein